MDTAPRSRPMTLAPPARDGSGEPSSTRAGRKRILVIDDSRTVCASIKDALTSEGYLVERLDCFVDLPRAVRDSPPDLIVLDLKIPELSGVTMGKYVRKHELRRIPILIHSAAPAAELRAAALEINASGVLSKGVSAGELREAVARALEGARRSEQG